MVREAGQDPVRPVAQYSWRQRARTAFTAFVVTSILWLAFIVLYWPRDRTQLVDKAMHAAGPTSRARGQDRPVDASGSKRAVSYTPPPGGLQMPVQGVAPSQLSDTYGQLREGGSREHNAIDIIAPLGTPVLAATAGTIAKLFVSKNGGNTIYERSPDGQAIYYYAHLDAYASGLAEGQAVLPGQQLGFVGSSGDADPGAPHLHFAIQVLSSGEHWWQGTPINPFGLLGGR